MGILPATIEPSACRREEGRVARPTYMMKRKVFVLLMVLAAIVLLAGLACAETVDPIVTSMEISPTKLAAPGKVNVTITISNSGDTDLTDPVWLYDPAAQIVTEFGTEGAALLKAGESKTWTGTYDVNQRTLENGSVVYFVKYTLRNGGKAVAKSQPIRAKIEMQTPEADMDVKRTISPTIASKGQEVIVRYEIINSGTISLLDVTIQEHEDINSKKQTIPELKPGQTAEIKYPVIMGEKDLTSGANITFDSETLSKPKTYKVEEQVIRYGEPSLEAVLSSSANGVMINETITLTLKLKNTGSLDYSDIRVTDPALGDVFANQELKAGAELELTKEVAVPETMEYCFTVNATDETGLETSLATETVKVTAVDPADTLNLVVVATPDRTEVFEQPGKVRFTIFITNESNSEAKNVKVSHGETELYTFKSIPARETRTLTRDTALSMAGKYRFTVNAVDQLDTPMTFESNEMQIAFSVPTPAPATPTPVPDPTPEPTFAPATIPPLSDPSIGAVPKMIRNILQPVIIAAGVVLAGCGVLLMIAAIRRGQQKKASKAAIDQLERAKRRDYVNPSEEEEDQPQVSEEVVQMDMGETEEENYELPHMKYARSASAMQLNQPVNDSENDSQEYDSSYEDSYYDDTASWGQSYQDVMTEPQETMDLNESNQNETGEEQEGVRRSRRNRGRDADV